MCPCSRKLEVICAMSLVFLRGVEQHLPRASIPVDWFHIVQLCTRSVDEVRKLDGKEKTLPNHPSGAVLKRGHVDRLTTNHLVAVGEMTEQGVETMTAWKPKGKRRWIRKARTPRAAPWRMTHFQNYARALVGDTPRLEPVRTAPAKTHARRVVQRWTSKQHQCPPGGLQRAIPGRTGASPRIPQHRHRHHHDLRDREPPGSIHKPT